MSQPLSRLLLAAAALLALPFAPAMAAEKKTDVAGERAEIRKMRDDALAVFYKQKPELKAKVQNAPGYAVFTDYGITLFFVGGAGGRGIAVDNRGKKETFMNMGQASVGLGLGARDVRLLLVFKTPEAFSQFVDKGWEFGGGGTAAATVKDKGASDSASSSINDQIERYGIAKNGLMFETTLSGSKYWKSAELN